MKNLLRTCTHSPIALLTTGIMLGILLSFIWIYRQGETMKLRHLFGLMAAAFVLHGASSAQAQTYYHDNFDTGTVGTAPTGWVNVSGTWQISTTAAVTSPNAFGPTTTTDGTQSVYTGVSAVADMAVQEDSTAAVAYHTGLMVRVDAAGANGYLVIQTLGTSLTWYKKVSGGFSAISTIATSYAWTGTQNVVTKLQIQGSSLSFKQWATGGAEPVAFNYTVTDASITAAGYAGIRNNTGNAAPAASVDDFYVGAPNTTFAPGGSGGGGASIVIAVNDPNIHLSPYNWYTNGTSYIQSPNPGAYLKMGFSGTSIGVNIDVSALTGASVPSAQYPVLRYSVDGGQPGTTQLTSTTTTLVCGAGLAAGNHSLFLQYVAGYVFLDFWTPVNALRVTGFTVDSGAVTMAPAGLAAALTKNGMFLGDSITNGDNTTAIFISGVTNAVATQDAALGYVPPIAAATGEEYGIVAYGGASWDSTAADSHTPGLMTTYNMLDSLHSRLTGGKFSPVPDDIFINEGANAGPAAGDVQTLLTSLRAASSSVTNLWIIVPFGGQARAALASGVTAYKVAHPTDTHLALLDTGTQAGVPGTQTAYSVDGVHPLASLDALLAAEIVSARAAALAPVSTSGTKRRLQ